MRITSLPGCTFALALVGFASGFKGNFRMHVKTTRNCVQLTDENGVEAPCDKSVAPTTYGLTLPGMEDGSISMLKDVIVTKEGSVSVEAAPSRPYQYVMNRDSGETRSRQQLFRNRARPLGEEEVKHRSRRSADPTDGKSLSEGGWEIESQDASTITWYTMGVEGVDPMTGQNYTFLYSSGVAPNKWTLTTDLDEVPVKLVATNTYFENLVYQTSEFTNHESLPYSYTVSDAEADMYATYSIDTSRRLSEDSTAFPPIESSVSVEHVPEDMRQFYESNKGLDWLNSEPGNLRRLGKSAGIPYFTIEAGSAAEKFFNAQSYRRLVQVVNFEFPESCSEDESKSKYCLSLAVDYDTANYGAAVSAGCTFKDTNNPEYSASLKFSLKLGLDYGFDSLTLDAEGCAVVWAYGIGKLNLNIQVCLSGQVEIKTDQGAGKVGLKVTFGLSLPVVNNLISATIESEVGVIIKPNNDITATGKVGVSASVKIAGAGMGLDIKANTLNNNAKEWYFDSGAYFNAWVNIWVWGDEWEKRYQIWDATLNASK